MMRIEKKESADPKRLVALACGLSILLLSNTGFAREGDSRSLVNVSFGGAYGAAQVAAWLRPFTAETGIVVRQEDYNGGLAQIRAQVETGNVYWDIADLELSDAVLGCDEGLFEPVSPDDLPLGANGESPRDDYYPSGLADCSVSNVVYSTVITYNDSLFKGKKPTSVQDFFDLKKFPGRRGLRRSPVVTLEFALMADGVPINKVYEVLDTDRGLDRAYRKLDSIKDHVVWWETGAQPPQMLADSEVIMSSAWNGRIFNAQVLENQPFVIIWDGQVLDIGHVGILAGSKNVAAARQYLAYISRPEVMASLTRYISYGPARRSANAFVSTHLATGVEMPPHLPNFGDRPTRSLNFNWEWWADRGDEMNEIFATWLAR